MGIPERWHKGVQYLSPRISLRRRLHMSKYSSKKILYLIRLKVFWELSY